MPRDPRAWLSDIVAACDLLVEFTEGKAFGDYAADPLLRLRSSVSSRQSGHGLGILERRLPQLRAEVTRLLNEFADD